MKRSIADIDKNLQATFAEDGVFDWYSVTETPELSLHGVFHNGTAFCRMPDEIAQTVSESVTWLARHTAGGRVRFQTTSPQIAVKLVLRNEGVMPHMPATGSHGASVYCNGRYTGVTQISPLTIDSCLDEAIAYNGVCTMPLQQRKTYNDITICMPLYCGVHKLYIGIMKEHTILPPKPYRFEKPIVFYGNSITQGGCASHPGSEYVGLLSKWLDFDYINLGFSGSGKGEPQMVDYLASLDASAYVIDYDHNADTPEHLQATHYPLYKTIRQAHPTAPILFLTKPDCDNDPNAYIRKKIIYKTYATAKKAGDTNVYFLDGKRYYGKNERDCNTVDLCHPTDLGFYKIAKTIRPGLQKMLDKINEQ